MDKVLYILMLAAMWSCKDNSVKPNTDPTPNPDGQYTAPKYADDYRSVSSWANNVYWGPYNLHDPSMEKDGDWYYVFGTDASFGNAIPESAGHFHARRSKDLVNWEYLGGTMPSAPLWVADSLNSKRSFESAAITQYPNRPAIASPQVGYWAPCVRKVSDNLYRMYYSIPVFDEIIANSNTHGERAFIGLRESTSLTGPWIDKGMVITSQPDGLANYPKGIYLQFNGTTRVWAGYYRFNAIDPSYIITPEGKHWLIYGSWHCGIAAVELDPATGKPKSALTPAIAPASLEGSVWNDSYGTRIMGRGNISDFTSNRWQGLEGPEIVYNAQTGYYYLFAAYDELMFAYNTRVCRSRTITGDYYGMDGQNQTKNSADAQCWPMVTHPYKFKNHPGWQGISHCSIFFDKTLNKWFFNSQARLSASVANDNSVYLMVQHIREIIWTEDGWPLVSPERYAAVPETSIPLSSILGTWEHIDQSYNYGKANVSVDIKLNADFTITKGTTKAGTFSYDPAKKKLSISWTLGFNATYQAYVHNGLDWEASPRKTTILYVGVTADGRKTIWGKKS